MRIESGESLLEEGSVGGGAAGVEEAGTGPAGSVLTSGMGALLASLCSISFVLSDAAD